MTTSGVPRDGGEAVWNSCNSRGAEASTHSVIMADVTGREVGLCNVESKSR